MPTIPTGEMERELRKRYLRFISGLTLDSANMAKRLREFEASQLALIESMGGRTAMLGALGDFPVARRLDLSPWQGTIYNDMQTTAIQASIIAGNSSKDAAQQMFRAGMDKSYRRLERLARTETTNAYWKNSFDSIKDLPALVMVWGSEDGPRTCAWCRERDGLVMDSSNLRDHPNGRCTPIPTLRSLVQYRGSIDSGGRIYMDDAWGKKPTARKDMSVEDTAQQVSWETATPKNLPRNPLLDDDLGYDAADIYMSEQYEEINSYLRTGVRWSTDDDFLELIDVLKDITNTRIEKDVVLHRSLSDINFLGEVGTPEQLIGKSFTDKGFVSTSWGGSSAYKGGKAPYQLEILTPKGVRGSLLDNDAEKEFLLAPGTTFTVVETKSVAGKLILRVLATQEK